MTLPDDLKLVAEHDTAVPPAELAAAYLDLLRPLGLGELSSWRIGTNEHPRSGSLIEALRAGEGRDGFDITTARAAMVGATHDDYWTVTCRRPSEADAAITAEWMRACVPAVRILMGRGDFRAAVVARTPSRRFRCVPAPPVARRNHLIAFPDAEVVSAYPEKAFFWSRWDGVEAIGENRLAWRALDATEDEAWARAVLADQLALARLAAPGTTIWPWKAARIDCDPSLMTVEGHGLEPVGYLPGEQVLELAGYFQPDQHVPLRDIMTIRALLAARQTRDGHPLRGVRVMFADAAMAKREAVPLLDASAEVAYLNEDGERRVLDPADL